MKPVFLRPILAIGIAITMPVFADTAAVFENFKIGAKILLDHSSYDGVHHEDGKSGNQTEIRFVRVYMTKKFDEHWNAMFQIQFNQNEGTTTNIIKEAFLKYKSLGTLDITIGKRKEPFGLQMLVNAERVLFMERSIISSSFAPERSVGLTLSSNVGKSNFEAGVYSQSSTGNGAYATGGAEAGNEEKHNYAITGRATFTPFHQNHSLIHLGLAGSIRDFGANEYQLKDRAEVFLTKKLITSGKTIADNLILFGLEAAAQFGSYSLQSEYMQLSVDGTQGDNNASYDGYYIQLGYFLTEGYRAYKNGKFGAVTPVSKNGTWQLMARYSALDAEDNNAGVKLENIALGVNWFANTSVRISANYIITEVNGIDANPTNDDGDAFSVRFQYVF